MTLAVGVLSAEAPCRVLQDTVNLRSAGSIELCIRVAEYKLCTGVSNGLQNIQL
jgi:hypothetical protein